MKKLMLFLMVGMFMISFASAAEWDNVKSYDAETKTATITNALGLGEDIATIKLETELNEVVGLGYQKVAEFTINSFDDYNDAFKEMEFYDINDGNKKIVRNFDYKYKSLVPYNTTILSSCEGQDNKSCVQEVSYKVINKVVWNDFNESSLLPKGEVTIGIFTNVEAGDYVEWIPNLFGERIEEWATWTGNLNVDLVAYYSLNETSGNMIDQVNGYDGVCLNTPNQNVVGKISNGIDFIDTSSEECIVADIELNNLSDEATWGGWFNPDQKVSQDYMISRSADNQGRQRYSLLVEAGGSYRCTSVQSNTTQIVVTSSRGVQVGTWANIICRLNSTHLSIWVNGTVEDATAWDGTFMGQSNNFTFGNRGDPSTAQFYNGQMDEIGIWNRSLSDAEITALWNGGSGITYNSTAVNLTLLLPVNEANLTSNIVNMNGQVNLASLANVSLILDGAYNETNSSGITSAFYNFSKTVTFAKHNWTFEICNTSDVCSNGTTRNFTVTRFQSYTNNASSFETENETFYTNYTSNGSTVTAGKLSYNGTNYTATVTNTAGNDYNLSVTIDIPTTAETKPFRWWATSGGIEYGSPAQSQIINLTNFTYCASGTPFMNISFKNETVAEEGVTALIPSSTWYYYLGGGTKVKTLSFSNSTEFAYYNFCLDGVNRTVYGNLTMTYDNSISEQRNYLNTSLKLDNSTFSKTLFLLPTNDGIFVTFQIINTAEQVLEGVFVNATNANGDLVSSAYSDAAGSVTFFLNPNTVHTFYYILSGYTTLVESFAPTQTEYTVSLGGATTTTDTSQDYTRGIEFVINPRTNSPLFDHLIYPFNFSLSSNFWNVISCGFTLYNTTNASLASNSSTGNDCSSGILFNVSGQDDLAMDYWWNINNTFMNGTRTYKILSPESTQWSINNTITDFRTYLNSGMFGMDNFAVALIIFMVLMLTVGVMAFKYGLTSPTAISMLMFFIILFLDVGLNLMSTLNPFGVDHFITIFAGLVMVSMFFRSVIR